MAQTRTASAAPLALFLVTLQLGAGVAGRRSISGSSVTVSPCSPTTPAAPVARVTSIASTARRKDDYDDDYGDDYDDYGTKKKKKKKPTGVTASASNETNVFNFVRLMVMRLVWGFASWLGFEEPLSEVFNGAFVPPGADDYDDDGFDFGGDYREY